VTVAAVADEPTEDAVIRALRAAWAAARLAGG
jgi:hypothetical protein